MAGLMTGPSDTTPDSNAPPPAHAAPAASLYVGRVMHRRLRPFGHRFAYRVFMMLIDIDRIDEAAQSSRLFSHNRFNLFSYSDRDHGGASSRPDGGSPRRRIETLLDAADIDIGGGTIRLLCFPRILGFVFNPLSIFFCHGRDGELAAILYEVHNTFGDRHSYLFRIEASAGHASAGRAGDISAEGKRSQGRSAVLTHEVDKHFHVSPFIGMSARYRFRLRDPGDKLSILIRETDAGGDLLLATLNGERADFSDRTLARLFVTHPLMTLKVVGAIHFQAMKLWWKGARFHRHPGPPSKDVSLPDRPTSLTVRSPDL